MLEPILLFGGGLALLTLGAEFLVRGSSRLAAKLGVPALVVGLTVVAYGTSTPELIVSTKAALGGQADLSLGNVIGSNILNILLILGVSACVSSLVVSRKLIRQEIPIMIALSAAVYALGLNGVISRWEGLLLFLALLVYTVFQVRQGLKAAGAGDPPLGSVGEEKTKRAGAASTILLIAGGLTSLVIGAQWLLEASVTLARHFGMSEFIIGLTVVAAGTSLPEAATSILATFRGERDIAVGNVIGSNIFNILGVLGLSALISPDGVRVASAALSFDIPIMIAAAVACLPIFLTGHKIDRWEGGVFLFYYAAYTAYLVLDARQHDLLPLYSATMLIFALPLTVLTIAVLMFRHLRANNR
jgi:cation:H+ antiporter